MLQIKFQAIKHVRSSYLDRYSFIAECKVGLGLRTPTQPGVLATHGECTQHLPHSWEIIPFPFYSLMHHKGLQFTCMDTKPDIQVLSTLLANSRPLALTPSQGVWSVLGRLDPRKRPMKVWKWALSHLAGIPHCCCGPEKEAGAYLAISPCPVGRVAAVGIPKQGCVSMCVALYHVKDVFLFC